MASSFSSQIPTIIHLIQKLSPKSVLDIGKGFGKYGFLIHEYIGINNKERVDPKVTMADQSRVKIDAVEVDEDLLLPHLSQFYNKVFFGDVFSIQEKFEDYDLILMIDVIEHLDKQKAIELLKNFLLKNSTVLIATPIHFFQQELYGSDFEHHISHWKLSDFKQLGFVEHQYFNDGAIYLLSNNINDIRGFGSSFLKKFRRIARAIKNEM